MYLLLLPTFGKYFKKPFSTKVLILFRTLVLSIPDISAKRCWLGKATKSSLLQCEQMPHITLNSACVSAEVSLFTKRESVNSFSTLLWLFLNLGEKLGRGNHATSRFSAKPYTEQPEINLVAKVAWLHSISLVMKV